MGRDHDALLNELEELYRARFTDFLRVARAIVGDRERAVEAVQDGFADAISGRDGYRGEGPLGALSARRWRRATSAASPRGRQPGDETIVLGSYHGAKFQTVDADDRIDGGCIGVAADGTVWTCYLGELAVEHDILDPEVLGQEQTSPGHG